MTPTPPSCNRIFYRVYILYVSLESLRNLFIWLIFFPLFLLMFSNPICSVGFFRLKHRSKKTTYTIFPNLKSCPRKNVVVVTRPFLCARSDHKPKTGYFVAKNIAVFDKYYILDILKYSKTSFCPTLNHCFSRSIYRSLFLGLNHTSAAFREISFRAIVFKTKDIQCYSIWLF